MIFGTYKLHKATNEKVLTWMHSFVTSKDVKWPRFLAHPLVVPFVTSHGSLDLACKILSPADAAVAGLIMTYASLLVSAIVILASEVGCYCQ